MPSEGSICYPYYPSREHFCKPSRGAEDFIDIVNLDGWTVDFLCARIPGRKMVNGEPWRSRQGVGPIETLLDMGTERGLKSMLVTTATHFDDGFQRNGFAWVTCGWEMSLVEARKIYGYGGRNGMEGLHLWLQCVDVAGCPAGHDSQYRQRDETRHTTAFRFDRATCDACPLRKQCLAVADQKFGRSVRLNDYEPEYEALRQRKLTDEYAAVKKEHPKVERRPGELVNRHDGRRARYRGRCRVWVQQLIAGTIHNVKRMVRLLDRETGFSNQ